MTGCVQCRRSFSSPPNAFFIAPVVVLPGEDELLARCYRSCFDLAREHDLQSIAFPAISAGSYGFPMDRACRIAAAEMTAFLKANGSMEVIAVCFSPLAYDGYIKALQTAKRI